MRKLFLLLTPYSLILTTLLHADTIYLTDGATQKGLIVEEYYDRFVFSTEEGEKEILKSSIDEIFFDEPYQNNLYLGKKFEQDGDFENALKFYRLSIQSNPNFKDGQDAVKGLEDAKWRFKKSWRYSELEKILKSQLEVSLKDVHGKIIVKDHIPPTRWNGFRVAVSDTLQIGDVLISSWAQPLTYAGLKRACRFLIGLSNTMLKLIIERDIKLEAISGFNLFSPLIIGVELQGPMIKFIKEESAPYKAGLRKGDLIVKIDGVSTRYMELKEIKRRIFNSKNKTVTARREVILMRRRTENNKGHLNAIWVWHSKEVLLDEAHKKELLDFCKEKNIGTLFFQLQYEFKDGICKLLYELELRAFIKEAHSDAIKIHLLDGSPTFCLEKGHPLVLAQLKAIMDFNSNASVQERCDGVHYDNEPYLLPVFQSNLKEDIIRQFILLNQKCRDLISSSGVKLEFGIDIPFWFDELDRLDAKLIDICDNIGIMDYRNFASGPDGIVHHALDELKYAASVGKKVYVGVETSQYPRQEVYFVSCVDIDKFSLLENKFEGFETRVYRGEKYIYIGLVKSEGVKEEDFNKGLFKLSEQFGKITRPKDEKEYNDLIFNVQHDLSGNPEFSDIQPQEYTDEGGNIYLIFKAKEAMLEKLTFANLTEKDLNLVLSEAKKEFETYPSFIGFAIHHYRSYKTLCEKRE